MPPRQSAMSRWSRISPSHALAVRNSLEWVMNTNVLFLSENRMATEVAAGALGEEWKGHVVQSVVGITRCLDSWRNVQLLLTGSILVTDPGEQNHVLWMSTWVFSTWLLLKRILLDLCFGSCGPKHNLKAFQSLKRWYPPICCQKAPKQRLEVHYQSTPNLVSCYSMCLSCNTNAIVLLWRNSTPRKMRRLQNMLNF